MSNTVPEPDEDIKQINSIDVNKATENGINNEKTSDSGVDITDASCSAFFPSSDSELSPLKSVTDDLNTENIEHENPNSAHEKNSIDSDSLSSPVSVSSEDSPDEEFLRYEQSNKGNSKELLINAVNGETTALPCNLKINSDLAVSTASLNNETSIQSINKSYSRSAENISENQSHSNEETLDKDQILSEFLTQKNKVAAVQKIPENQPNLDVRYPRLPKELLPQDIGSIVKNVHGIFSSVSGSLKHAYSQRTVQRPVPIKPVPNSKVMKEIFEDDNTDQLEGTKNLSDNLNIEQKEMADESQAEIDPKFDVLKLQIESLERVLFEQRKENASLRERVKQQVDEMQEKDQTFKELEGKLDLMSKRVEQAEREKDAAVMRYASVECASIEARRAADVAARAEKAAQAEMELLNNKLKSAHAEKQRIIQLYDDKCHEISVSERELSKVREDIKELEGRLKWTQSKLRMEMDAYKESSERADKLAQQVADLEASREAYVCNSADTAKAKQFESELKECRAALILCRHENEELDKRLTSVTQQLDACKKERDSASGSLKNALAEIEQLKISNLKLEEEAAELAALRAKAALADTLSAQLQREVDRANSAESALSAERARSETCVRREEAALRHAAALTAAHCRTAADVQRQLDTAQALSADNESLRERVTSLELERDKLQSALNEECERRNKENKVLARKVAELTEEVSELNKKLEWEKGENSVLKKKHASAIKELNRELQRSLKRCEQLEAKLPPPDAPSTRTGSVSSLSSSESTQQEERLQNGQTDTMPELQIKCPSIFGNLFTKARSPDKQALIERIVSLQRAAARRSERCEFLEEHSRQLTHELRNKSRLLRHLLATMPHGAVATQRTDINKKEIARLGGGAMAAVWGGDPNGMTLELSLEMNKRLQAVLEDTLLSNITLKENMETLGAEISKLKEQQNTTKEK